MIDYKTLSQDSCFLNFSAVQARYEQNSDQINQENTLWEELFNRIRYLWDQNSYNDEIEEEISRNVRSLYYFLKREKPPDEIYQKLCSSGLFVEMFSSMKSTNYKDFVLGIICLIIKQKSDTVEIMLKRNLSDSFDTFLFSRGTNKDMQIRAPFFTSMFLKNLIKSNELPSSFFFSPGKNGFNYFQISLQIIDKCLAAEKEKLTNEIGIDMSEYSYIQKTERYIYSFFSYIIKLIALKNQDNEHLIKPIFIYISQAFEMKLVHLYKKLIICLNRIWDYSYDCLLEYFFDESIYKPICSIINTQKPKACQQNAIEIIYKFLDKNFAILTSEINSESVFQTANESIGMMMKTNVFDKTTINAILLLGKKFIGDNEISLNVEKDMIILIGLIESLINDLDFLAKNAAAYLTFAIVKISGLLFFNDKLNIIEAALDVPLSGDFYVVEAALNATDAIFGLIDNGDECASLLINPLQQFISAIYELNEFDVFAEHIQSLYTTRCTGEK